MTARRSPPATESIVNSVILFFLGNLCFQFCLLHHVYVEMLRMLLLLTCGLKLQYLGESSVNVWYSVTSKLCRVMFHTFLRHIQ